MSKVFLIGESLNKFNQAIQWLKNKNRERALNRKISKIIDDQKKISDYLVKEYLNPYLSSEGLDLSISQEREKIIWQYWNAGLEEAPAIVKASIDSVRKNLPDGYRHVILCDKNIHEYVDIPDWVKDKYLNNRSFRATFFSDVLRLLLLEKYGGVWVDATIFMSSEIPSHVLNSPFFVFYRGLEPSDSKIYEKFNPMYFSWRPNFKVRLCSSFIISNKSHPFVSA